ncbi:G1 family endopeptidase [Streptomyces sp. SL13]|jgi:hypothetical protein|uniref:G1 family endopeptidase n=1 Tax=Streptantibioticus silvisoli TaxID=2705255 RepID=A0AA90KIA0_9ACTN|nr:G1 family glutamic endopeptidase [Streptantibioticus silvisoli]MDI5961773.1 G1 family endopeptidase [Streptantibioticus silvisoli]MDI5972389.1 G1 family endopeptidase [Streptantibioticus silvisoli]
MSATFRISALSAAAAAAALLSAAMMAPQAGAVTPHALRMTPMAGQRIMDPHGRILHSSSSNWAGYSATGGTFTSVSSSWVQPKGTCTSKDTYAAFWIGIDGDGSDSVEQTGSEVDCSGGSPQYYAWYEMYPAYPVNYTNTVKAGDHFTSTVSVSGSTFTLKLADTTQGWTKTTTKTSSTAEDASAEIIAEAPASDSVLPLTNFGTASFTGATANGEPIGDFDPDQINMASGSTTKATTSALSGGENFSVTWDHN